MLENTINEIVAWCNVTFPESTAYSKLKHLEKEVLELRDAIFDYDTAITINGKAVGNNVKFEIADCLIILFHIANEIGMEIEAELLRKHALNKTRKWCKPDKDGVIEHDRNYSSFPKSSLRTSSEQRATNNEQRIF